MSMYILVHVYVWYGIRFLFLASINTNFVSLNNVKQNCIITYTRTNHTSRCIFSATEMTNICITYHDLTKRTHFHYVLELFIHISQSKLT